MREIGNVVATASVFTVVELCERHQDNTVDVIGYHVYGPGCNPTWIYSREDALTKLAAMARDYRP